MEQTSPVVTLVGDFMLERRLDPADIAAVRPLFDGSGLVIANLDTVLSDQGTPAPKFANLRGPRDLARDLRALGIDVAVLANNHAMDFRAEGLRDMRRALDEAGIAHVGAGENLAEAAAPLIVERGGRTIAILARSCTLPYESEAGPDWPGIAPLHVRHAFVVEEQLLAEQPGSVPSVKTWVDEDELSRLTADVTAARSQADHLLVVMHWGVPPAWRAPAHPIVQEHQRLVGRALINAGADAVIGNHPHELHEIELHAGKPIAYCLGNFWIDTIADYPWMGREGIALSLTLSGEAGPAIAIRPHLLDEGGIPRSDETGRALGVLRAMCRTSGVAFAPSGDATLRLTADAAVAP